MMPYKLIAAIFLSTGLANICNGQTVELYCKGKAQGDLMSGEGEFELNVSFANPSFWGIPNKFVLGCMDLSEKAAEKCSATSNFLNCSCSNSVALTTISLSRVTGRLTIENISLQDKRYSKGGYECNKVSSRKF